MDRRELLALACALGAGGLLSEPGRGKTQGADETTTETETTGEPTDGRTSIEELVDGNTGFALDLLSVLSADTPNANFFFSPYSISVALAMTYAGARGETRAQMGTALQFPAGPLAPRFGRLQTRLDALETEPAPTRTEPTATPAPTEEPGATATRTERPAVPFRLSVANAPWGQTGYPFARAYLQLLERNYGAGLRQVDFESEPEGSRRTINQWVAENTGGKITDLLAPGAVTELTRLVLTNAVYFRANWLNQFDEANTADRPFTSLDGAERTVPMMAQRDTFPYAAVDGHQLIELPYAGGSASMVVLLPAPGQFAAFERSLDAARLSNLLSQLDEREGTIRLPRFTTRTTLNLKPTLSALGMPAAFSGDADFSGMLSAEAPEDFRIDDVVHESFVAVDEAGTEAAAATAVIVGTTAVGTPEEAFEMTVDRPFLFAIREETTGTVLFLGRIVDLESSS